MSDIGVLGAGTWGMALSRMLANTGHSVTVWSALPEEIDNLNTTKKHPNLPGMDIPESIVFTKDIKEAVSGKEVLVMAVPSVYVRGTTETAKEYIENGQIIVDVAKGIEPDTLLTMTQVIRDVLHEEKYADVKLVALSGPTHAEEVAKDMPSAIVSACRDYAVACKVQDIFMNTCMRVYTNPDILGVELCGALKNVIALASGISTGLGYGDNSKAALITRGMCEIAELGTKMGCLEQTFVGLAGVGDLIVTANSVHSRNNRCGILIGQGVEPKEAIKQVGMVVEGVNALPACMELMKKYDVEMPIAEAVNAVVNEGADLKQIVLDLMLRNKRTELSTSAADIVFEYTNHS